MATIGTERDDWSIHIRTDQGAEPVIEVRSEEIIRTFDGRRVVVRAMPMLSAALSKVADLPITLRDGHTTTIGDVVAALRQQCSRAIDSLECSEHDGRQQCLCEHMMRGALIHDNGRNENGN